MKDIFGILCSMLCVLHCSLSPLLLVLGISAVGFSFLEQEWIHLALAAPMFLLAAISFPKSYQLHKHFLPLFMGFLGTALMVASIVGPHEYEGYFAVSAGFILIAAHFINRRLLLRFYESLTKNAVSPSTVA